MTNIERDIYPLGIDWIVVFEPEPNVFADRSPPETSAAHVGLN